MAPSPLLRVSANSLRILLIDTGVREHARRGLQAVYTTGTLDGFLLSEVLLFSMSDPRLPWCLHIDG